MKDKESVPRQMQRRNYLGADSCSLCLEGDDSVTGMEAGRNEALALKRRDSMDQEDSVALREALQRHWSGESDAKAAPYVDRFSERTRAGRRIGGHIAGNHGTYTVSIDVKGDTIEAACSCYIGRSGYCHHCHALAHTFLHDPDSFQTARPMTLENVHTPDDLEAYLRGTTLDSLIQALKTRGITQAQFAASIGMKPRQLSAIKSSERRNRYFNELGATKVACLWMLEHFGR